MNFSEEVIQLRRLSFWPKEGNAMADTLLNIELRELRQSTIQSVPERLRELMIRSNARSEQHTDLDLAWDAQMRIISKFQSLVQSYLRTVSRIDHAGIDSLASLWVRAEMVYPAAQLWQELSFEIRTSLPVPSNPETSEMQSKVLAFCHTDFDNEMQRLEAQYHFSREHYNSEDWQIARRLGRPDRPDFLEDFGTRGHRAPRALPQDLTDQALRNVNQSIAAAQQGRREVNRIQLGNRYQQGRAEIDSPELPHNSPEHLNTILDEIGEIYPSSMRPRFR